MSAAGFVLVGLAVGVILGGLATYGAIFAWAMGYKLRENQDE